MKSLSAIVLAVFLPVMAAGAPALEAGVNYQVLDNRQPTSVAPDQVEVIEFFWYACPHCYAFEPYLENWLAHKPANVKFVRVPVVQGYAWAHVMAQAYYTEKVLGVEKKLHEAIFKEIHARRHMLKTKADFKSFFEKHGVSGDDFDKAWGSFAVAVDLKRAANRQTSYKVLGVPTVAVAGRYTATLHAGQGVADLPDVIQFLVDKEIRKNKQ